jgi:hypothetical protein
VYANTISSSTADTDLTLSGNGTGVVNISDSLKVDAIAATSGTNTDLKLAGKGTGKAKLYSELQIPVIGWTTPATTGDGKFYIHIGKEHAGKNIVYVHAEVITAGITGTLEIDLRNVTQSNADILTNNLKVDSTHTGSDTSSSPASINASEDDLQENDLIAIDIDAIHSGTPSEGLIITIGMELP